MLSRLLGLMKASEPLDYEISKAMSVDADPMVRKALASRQDVRPELLYYLAEDRDSAVRREVAANPATPGQADLLLARDHDDEVRCDLARKIGRLLPELSPEQTSRVEELAIEALEILAQDQLPRVRAILAEELKHSSNVPKLVVRRLASDMEAIVAAPILEYSPLLSDDDLLEIIASGVARGALPAIARRQDLGASVSDAVVVGLDVPAVAALLANPSAQIREETLDAIIDHAADVEIWHEPLVLRPELSVRAIRRISQFVAASLVSILADRHQLPEDLAEDLRRAVRRRLDAVPVQPETQPGAAERAAVEHRGGRLDEERILAALEANDREFVIHALAMLSGLQSEAVVKIAESRSAKAVTALAWKAGLAMRTAVRLQARLAHLPPASLLYARQGLDYPLGESEMNWQIEYFSG